MSLVLLTGAAARADDRPLLLRYPTLHGGKLVFVAAGNLWEVDRGGGRAARLTSDAGQDLLPRFSPDGKWIAYTGSAQGNQDVYVIPAAGGEARRLTFHSDIVAQPAVRWGPDNMVITWTPDSKNIVFQSRRAAWNAAFGRAFSIPLEGGLAVPLPIDRNGFLTYGPDGHSIAFTRIFRDFRTWKRYDGGLAQDVYTYDFQTRALDRITDWKGTDTSPMWFGRHIYFLSDRDPSRRENIWVYDLDTKAFRQITHFTEDDIRFPSLGDNGLTFSLAGRLYVVDLPSEQLHAVDVDVPDDGTRSAVRTVKPFDQLRTTDTAQQPDDALSPNGKRALFSARGDIFSVPASHGAIRDLTRTSGADEDHPAWSPDGATIAYTTDGSGAQQIAVRPAEGGPERLVTHFANGFYYRPVFSPDGRMLAFSDATHGLWVVPVAGGAPRKLASDVYDEIHDQAWSPDGRILAYSIERPNHRGAICLTEIASGHTTEVSSPLEDDSIPEFSADGKYLFFVSTRHENPTFSDVEQDFADLKTQGVYAATLARDTPSPFAPQVDESVSAPSPKPAAPRDPGKATAPIRIDLDGLMDRAVPVPVPAGDITLLASRGARLFYRTQPPENMDGDDLPGESSELRVYDLDARKDARVIDDVDAVSISADGTRFLAKHGKAWIIADAKPGAPSSETLKLDTARIRIDPRAEWAEMFENAWRLDRHLFYSPKWNGVDWQKVHDHYAAIEKLVATRDDLNEVIGQMIGELGNSHTYVSGGDDGDPIEAAPTPLLGVDFGIDRASGRYEFARIYRGDGTRASYRSPLAAPGLGVAEGDRLLAVDGVDVRAPANPFEAFVAAPSPLELTVASGRGKPRTVTVEPVKSELSLREQAWIDDRRGEVDRLSHGRIGYIYLSNMDELGMEQFIRQFYPLVDKEALIVDDRWNGGGFIDQMLLERLRRVLVGMSTNREGAAMTIPRSVLVGPKICLVNFFSASDGDIFPFYFRKYGLGQIVGTRTWGGVRGIRGPWTLLDGGYVTIPEDSLYGLDSQWVMENHGVDPDVVVDDAADDFEGQHDRQLETAVALLMKQIGPAPHGLPPEPPLLPAYPPDGR